MKLWLDAQLPPLLAGWINQQVLGLEASAVRDLHGPPPQLIWLRVGNCSNEGLQQVLSRTFDQALALLQSGEPWVEIRPLAG